MTSALGQYLLEQQWIEREELEDALLNQQEAGGRLGTSLLEMGLLSEDQLLGALSQQQQAPVATASDLAEIAPDVTHLLPPKIASRHLAVPFRAMGSRVDIALARTDNLAQLDELSFVMGKTLRPHVAVEARLYHALENYYRVPCPRRFRRLVERLDRTAAEPAAANGPRPVAEAALPGGAEAPTTDTRLKSGPRRNVRELRAPSQRSIPLSEDERRALEPTMPGPRLSLAEQLASAGSPDAIGRLLLAALDEHFVRTLLFRVARSTISGWLGHGPGIDRDWLAGYSVGLRQATVFRQIQSDGLFRGHLTSSPPHDSLARCWGGGLQHECLVAAVRVRDRMVCAFYGDRGPLGLRGLEEDAVQQLSGKAGLAFERLILDRKLRR